MLGPHRCDVETWCQIADCDRRHVPICQGTGAQIRVRCWGPKGGRAPIGGRGPGAPGPRRTARRDRVGAPSKDRVASNPCKGWAPGPRAGVGVEAKCRGVGGWGKRPAPRDRAPGPCSKHIFHALKFVDRAAVRETHRVTWGLHSNADGHLLMDEWVGGRGEQLSPRDKCSFLAAR